MAFVTPGTKCAICGERIAPEPAAALRPFIRNAQDPLFPLSGRAFHKRCFHAHPLHLLAIDAIGQRDQRMLSVRCAVCGDIVVGRAYTTDLLTSDAAAPLSRFNYLFFHEEHLGAWQQRAEFDEAIHRAEAHGRWAGEALIKVLI